MKVPHFIPLIYARITLSAILLIASTATAAAVTIKDVSKRTHLYIEPVFY